MLRCYTSAGSKTIIVVLLLLASAASASAQAQGRLRSINNSNVRNSSFAQVNLLQDPDGYIDVVYVSWDGGGTGGNPTLKVHVLTGRSNYASEAGGFPKTIHTTDYGIDGSPTVAIGNINFSDYLSVVVGGDLGPGQRVFAFKPDGTNVPGFPTQSFDPPFFNAMAILEANLSAAAPYPVRIDGAPRIIGADESTCMQRWNGLGFIRQVQRIATDVISSVALGDVGQLNSQVADGVPDEIGAGLTDPFRLRAYDSKGQTEDVFAPCGAEPPADMLLDLGPPVVGYTGGYASSVAVADLDHDPGTPTQDMAILHSFQDQSLNVFHRLEVFASFDGYKYYDLPAAQCDTSSQNCPVIAQRDYSSPAIADLDGDANGDGSPVRRLDTIVIGTDSGHVIALRYVPGTGLVERWRKGPFDGGLPISASPIVALLWKGLDPNHPYRPNIIFANDAGKVHVLDADGNDMQIGTLTWGPYDLGGSSPNRAVVSTPSVWTRQVQADHLADPLCHDDDATLGASNCPVIVAGNRNGTYEIILTGFPPFHPDWQADQWPTFHRSITRTGALLPTQDNSTPSAPTFGSIGGVAGTSCRASDVQLYDSAGNGVPDYYVPHANPAHYPPQSDGRFLFEFLAPGDYLVRFNSNPAYDVAAHVNAGVLTLANQPSCP